MLIEPAPKSQKRRFDTKPPGHQFTQSIVFHYIKMGEFLPDFVKQTGLGFRGLVSENRFRSGLLIHS